MEFRRCVTLTIYGIYLVVFAANCAPLTDGNGIDQEDLNGEKMVELGAKLKLPKLQLLGRTLINIEKRIDTRLCDLNPCTAWTEWQGCDARPGQFGSKFKTRQCGVNTTCVMENSSRTEKEFGICIGFCPKDYNVTKNGFCLRFYADKTATHSAAEQKCQKDGGHLVNIDSPRKYDNVNSVLQGFSSIVWVDGRRKDVTSPWEFTYGSQKSFFKWGPSNPSNGSNDLCIYVYQSSGVTVMDDYSCNSGMYILCEIIETQ